MQQQWQVRLFGGLRVVGEAREIQRFRTQKTGALVAYLAYHHRQTHPRDLLMALFWPDSPPDSARHNLRMALSWLRHQLEPEGSASGCVLRTDRATISLNAANVTTDVAAFETAFGNAVHQSHSAAATENWAATVELYHGPLLVGFYDDWIAAEQRRLEELFFQALHETVRRLEQSGDIERALQYAARGPIIDPLREAAQRDLMRLYAVRQPALALRQFHELETLLRTHLNCRPDAETLALAERLQNGAASTCTTPSEPIHFHAPLHSTRFFGRAAEMVRLHEMLEEPDTRLITLTGPGGSGKTRLATETVAHLTSLSARWPGGAWLVSLADLPDAALLVSALLETLPLQPAPDLDPFDELVSFLKQRPTLLLLDAFEHLVESGAPIVAQLLESVAGLTCVVTSRQKLHLAGEHNFEVPPLPLPTATEMMVPAALMAYDSVQLFVDRAQSVQPNFTLTSANAPLIAQLCERLEGIPLAIELAAARSGALTPTRMLQQLEHRFDFLVSRNRGTSSRHRTLQATIASSYQLLSPERQRFFAALSVFRGGCTLEAAQHIANAADALGALEALRDCSLVTAHEHDGEMRFHLLDSIREFGLQVLAGDERAILQRRHAEFFTALAESAAPELARSHAAECLERLVGEQDNLRAALEWSLAHEAELALRLAGALAVFWERRSQITEAQNWLERACQLPGAELYRARVLHAAGRIAFVQADVSAQALLEAALPLFRERADRAAIAQTLSMLGVIVWNRGQFGTAQTLFDQQLAVWHEVAVDENLSDETQRRGIAEALAQCGNLATAQCHFETARPLLQQATQHFRALHDDRGLAYVSDALAQCALLQGDHATARVLFERSVALYRGVGEALWIIRALWGRGHLARDEGDLVGALADYHQSIEIACRSRNRMSVPYLLEAVAVIAIARGQAPRGACLLGAAQALRDQIGLVVMPIWSGDYDRALSDAHQILGDAAFEENWAEGYACDWEQAADYALQETFVC